MLQIQDKNLAESCRILENLAKSLKNFVVLSYLFIYEFKMRIYILTL